MHRTDKLKALVNAKTLYQIVSHTNNTYSGDKAWSAKDLWALMSKLDQNVLITVSNAIISEDRLNIAVCAARSDQFTGYVLLLRMTGKLYDQLIRTHADGNIISKLLTGVITVDEERPSNCDMLEALINHLSVEAFNKLILHKYGIFSHPPIKQIDTILMDATVKTMFNIETWATLIGAINLKNLSSMSLRSLQPTQNNEWRNVYIALFQCLVIHQMIVEYQQKTFNMYAPDATLDAWHCLLDNPSPSKTLKSIPSYEDGSKDVLGNAILVLSHYSDQGLKQAFTEYRKYLTEIATLPMLNTTDDVDQLRQNMVAKTMAIKLSEPYKAPRANADDENSMFNSYPGVGKKATDIELEDLNNDQNDNSNNVDIQKNGIS